MPSRVFPKRRHPFVEIARRVPAQHGGVKGHVDGGAEGSDGAGRVGEEVGGVDYGDRDGLFLRWGGVVVGVYGVVADVVE